MEPVLEGDRMVDEHVLEELHASVEGDTGFVRDLIEAYLVDSEEQLEAIEAALGVEDAEALVRPAHTLKSSSATVGAMDVSALARTLEMAGRSGSVGDDETRRAAEVLRGATEATATALRAWIAGAEGQ
jgi:HPt (histidine-containing phosphotransfer) domain-containing protein